ncbi:MAG: co-chaperone DjlA [Proteobacteria bacterium]|nr:co-chaperone DjlA [Pseudomonadota bacterium]
MKITGKLIGALLGWILLRNPAGIVIGVLFGHLWDIGAIGGGSRMASPRDFIGPLFALAGAIAKSDGRVSEPEIAATENLIARLGLSAVQRGEAIARFKDGKQESFNADRSIAELRGWCGGRRDRAYIVLDLLLEIVFAEGTLAPEKLTLVRKLCATLGVHEQELAALAAMRGYGFGHAGGYRQSQPPPGATPQGKDPYAVLGITRTASEQDIKTAYRRLISQHHPDKLGDVPEALKRRAEERAREINAAYEKIRAERGIK